MTRTAAYGSWVSPISPAAVAQSGVKLREPAFDGKAVYWLESCPDEGGRNTVMRMAPDGTVEDLLAAPIDVRSAVHEYGGGAYAAQAGWVWFVNGADQTVQRRAPDGDITRLTSAGQGLSFADLQVDTARNRLIAVCEQHSAAGEPRASLVSIEEQGHIETLAEGRDFYASPRLSPDGETLAWLAWDHPNMPWDGTELWQAKMDLKGSVDDAELLAGGPTESLFQPAFAPDGKLYVVSDADNWWNIRRVGAGGLMPVTREACEFAQPQWVFGQSTYAFDADGSLYAAFTRDGLWQLAWVNRDDGGLQVYDLPFTQIEQVKVDQGWLLFIGADATTPATLCRMRCDGTQLERLRTAAEMDWDAGLLSTPEAVDYPSADGETAHALFYPPRNPDFRAPPETRPPLLIKCHGGPTGATSTAFDARIQFWTSRGFAVLDVNYRGSTGYGRAYRQRLYGHWGMADVQDCEYGARYLIDRGWIDPERIVISGSSAGGYTVLCVLAFTDLAAAGASYYGIGDLSALLATTHKFESRYLHRLIGDDPDLLAARSPLKHADRLSVPVLFLQGGKDKVVPPDQAEAMVAALKRQGLPVAHLRFPEERHGFRDAGNVRAAIAAELYFYGRVLSFSPADELPAIDIMNLD